MKSIHVTALITRRDTTQFREEVAQRIAEIQNDGCEVEIQYSPTNDFHSALIIGYKEIEGDDI